MFISNLTKRDIVICKGGERYRVKEKPEFMDTCTHDAKPIYKIVLCTLTNSDKEVIQLYYFLNGNALDFTHNDWDIVKVVSRT